MAAQYQKDKFSIAWFKLAEFVSRNEKEKALAIYKLLKHSLPEEAIAHQLEGDLLLAFDDPEAPECYKKAAKIYLNNGDIIKAATIYEHCLKLLPDSRNHLIALIKLYSHLNDSRKLTRCFKLLIKITEDKQKIFEELETLNLSNSQKDLLMTFLEKQTTIF